MKPTPLLELVARWVVVAALLAGVTYCAAYTAGTLSAAARATSPTTEVAR